MFVQMFVLLGFIIVLSFVHVKGCITNLCIFVKYVQKKVLEMADMYKKIDELLQQKGISGAKMSADLGMSRSFMTELRKGRAKSVKIETAQKIADYFGVSLSDLLGDEPGATRQVSDADIKFALFGGDGEITDEMYEEVRRFAQFVKERQKGG